MDVSEARKLRALEEENRRLKRLVADLSLDVDAHASISGPSGDSSVSTVACFFSVPRIPHLLRATDQNSASLSIPTLGSFTGLLDASAGGRRRSLFLGSPLMWQDSQVRRAFRVLGFVVAGLLVFNWVLGLLLRPKAHRLVAPSGHVYGVLSDLVSADGRYYLVYDASGSDLTTLSREADELLEMVTRDQRTRQLKTIGIEANMQHHFGLLAFGSSAGFVYELQGDRWVHASSTALDAHIRSSGAIEVK
jgi:hypothetical protein